MQKVAFLPHLTKKQRFVLVTILLSLAVMLSESLGQTNRIFTGIFLSLVTDLFLYLILKDDLKSHLSSYSFFILPFMYTLSFYLFYFLIPSRLIARAITTAVYAFGLYALFLTQNIFAVSSMRTITLLRSARIIQFVISIVVYFLTLNILFSLRSLMYFVPLSVFLSSFLLSYQLLWGHNLDKKFNNEIIFYSFVISLSMSEISLILLFWPVNATVYSLFITGIFYIVSGLSNTWFDQRLFKSVLWEYVWVGFLALLTLFMFSEWGI